MSALKKRAKKAPSKHRPSAAKPPPHEGAFAANPVAGHPALPHSQAQTRLLALRTPAGPPVQMVVQDARKLYEAARYWCYVVSNRRRFAEKSRLELEDRSRDDLERLLGVKEEDLKRIAEPEQPLVEVAIPFYSEETGWEQRTLPWESLLSLATKRWRGEKRLTVIRHLDCAEQLTAREEQLGEALVITSAPGELGSRLDFKSEWHLVASSVAGKISSRRLENPARDRLEENVRLHRPGIVHLSGVDAHQGSDLLGLSGLSTRRDGFFLTDESGGPVSVEALPMAAAVTGGGTHRPRLVAFNCYYSGSRLAAMAVAQGAQLAIGFQDLIDDFAAEQFFAKFYQAWSRFDWQQVRMAFELARLLLVEQPPERQGGDAVLWSRQSLVALDTNALIATVVRKAKPWFQILNETVEILATRGKKTAPAPLSPLTPGSTPATSAPPPSLPGLPPPAVVADKLDVNVKTKARLNYAVLHNDQSLFEHFTVNKLGRDSWKPFVEVTVQLAMGDGVEPKYSSAGLFEVSSVDYRDLVRLCLAASLLRGRRESVKTTMYVEVKHEEDHQIKFDHKTTYPVELLPAEEWLDDDIDRQWIPSFVLPRDAAVQKILDKSVSYLRTLADNSGAGFDGYQQSEGSADPFGVVDCQARAIWSALLYEYPLSYINPPPTYTPKSQRLRSPTSVLEEHRGTCIDLALLFSSCLEYIGLLPVLFLIQGHAFPGYWRSIRGQKDFIETPPMTTATPGQPWMFGAGFFSGIALAIQKGELVPLETTEVTQLGSFQRAVELGMKNLVTPWGFDAMVDIQIARKNKITPLPVFHNQA